MATQVLQARKALSDRIADADARGGQWLAKGNEHQERGQAEKAEACYAKGQFWLDRSNALRGRN